RGAERLESCRHWLFGAASAGRGAQDTPSEISVFGGRRPRPWATALTTMAQVLLLASQLMLVFRLLPRRVIATCSEDDDNSDDEWTKDDYIKQLAGDCVSKKMAEHRDELIRDLTQAVSSTVAVQVKDFAAQLAEHSLDDGRLAEGVQQLPKMAKDASEQFCSEKLDVYRRKFQGQLGGRSIRPRACGNRLDEHDAVLQTLREHIQELRGALALASAKPKSPPASAAGFGREVDATIIRAMASKLVELSAVQQVLADWIVQRGVDAKFLTISSPESVARQPHAHVSSPIIARGLQYAAESPLFFLRGAQLRFLIGLWFMVECYEWKTPCFMAEISSGEPTYFDRFSHSVVILEQLAWHLFESEGFQQQLKAACDKLNFADKRPRDRLSSISGRFVKLPQTIETDSFNSAARVLGLRNADIKLITAAINIQVSKLLTDWAPSSQRGYIPKRSFGVSILQLDVAARADFNSPSAGKDLSSLFALDFGAAFPSLAQSFMLMVMRIAEAVATLSLKLTKRMLVPLHVPFTEQLAENMRTAIAAKLSKLVYLGLVVGPAAGCYSHGAARGYRCVEGAACAFLDAQHLKDHLMVRYHLLYLFHQWMLLYRRVEFRLKIGPHLLVMNRVLNRHLLLLSLGTLGTAAKTARALVIGNDIHEAIGSLGSHAAGPHGSAALTSAQREAVIDHLDANRPLSNYHRELVAWPITHREALLHAADAREDQDAMLCDIEDEDDPALGSQVLADASLQSGALPLPAEGLDGISVAGEGAFPDHAPIDPVAKVAFGGADDASLSAAFPDCDPVDSVAGEGDVLIMNYDGVAITDLESVG
ncbi:unnamed protein product, partial [Prorocentrum cordatum]